MVQAHSTSYFGCLVQVPNTQMALVERLGAFRTILDAGCHCLVPCVDSVAGEITTKLQELLVAVETKTRDNVFVSVKLAVHFLIEPKNAYDAYYKLSNPIAQIKSNIEDVIRSEVPKSTLDQLFETKEEIAKAVSERLSHVMEQYGYHIKRTLVVDIDPDQRVKAAMNEINASERLKQAAKEKAEAHKISVIMAAEAEAKSKELQGVGIANQRKAIIEGLKNSVADFASVVEGATPNDAMNLVVLTQYFDTLKEIGMNGKSSTVFLPHSPGAVSDLAAQVRNGMLTAEAGAPRSMHMQ